MLSSPKYVVAVTCIIHCLIDNVIVLYKCLCSDHLKLKGRYVIGLCLPFSFGSMLIDDCHRCKK